jgi:hypothetical protein
VVVLVANAVIVVGLWLRHGGLSTSTGPGGILAGVGQLTGVLGAFAVLLQLLLMARMPMLERHIGFDSLAWWHRWNGFGAVVLIVVHVIAITMGYAAEDRLSVFGQLGDFVRHYPDVLMAIVGTAMLAGVAVTSARAARARLHRETWYSAHLYAYLARRGATCWSAADPRRVTRGGWAFSIFGGVTAWPPSSPSPMPRCHGDHRRRAGLHHRELRKVLPHRALRTVANRWARSCWPSAFPDNPPATRRYQRCGRGAVSARPSGVARKSL